jgi:hypothetical protein
MTTRDQLHERIDALPEELLPQAAVKLDEVGAARLVNDERKRRFLEAVEAFNAVFDPHEHPDWATEDSILEWGRRVRAEWDRGEELVAPSRDQ